jgi:amino-acid N-acetyltransferase
MAQNDIFPRPPEPAVRRLLEEAGLPTSDLTATHFEHFFGAGARDSPHGAVGIELHDRDALLRSLVVDESARGRGFGRALVEAAERYASERGARRMYLLTTTAAKFFGRLGYRPLARDAAPESIRATPEFATLCSADSAFMVKNLAAWTIASVIGYVLLVALVFVGVDIAVMLGLGVLFAAGNPAFDAEAWAASLGTNGVYLSISTIGAALVCIPFVKFLVARRSTAPWELLGVRRVGARVVFVSCLALAAFALASDLLTASLGRPIVPEFMTDVYATSPPLLLLVALTVAAPVLEEVVFRGLMIGALVGAGAHALVAAIVSALVWAAIHLQYDLYGIATIFFLGLLLAAVRIRTDSIGPCIAMHSLANAIAFAEAVWISGAPGRL